MEQVLASSTCFSCEHVDAQVFEIEEEREKRREGEKTVVFQSSDSGQPE